MAHTGRNQSITTNQVTNNIVVKKQSAISVMLSARATLTVTPPSGSGFAWGWQLRIDKTILQGSAANGGSAQLTGMNTWYSRGSP
jgi:hypothetical protein